MHIDLHAIKALQRLRIDLQEAAGANFPQSQLKELLLLYDVCKYLDLTYFQAQEVLGAPALSFVHDYLNRPICVIGTQLDPEDSHR